jgi:hypothetical protein
MQLTWVNSQLELWPEPGIGLTPESSFKIMIIIIFIFSLTQVNGQPDLWLMPDLE